jgi:hypothetical protein
MVGDDQGEEGRVGGRAGGDEEAAGLEIWSRKTTGSEKLLSFFRRHLEKLIGLPGSLAGSLADVLEETPRVFNCFFLARSFEEGVAAENLFSLGERTVNWPQSA